MTQTDERNALQLSYDNAKAALVEAGIECDTLADGIRILQAQIEAAHEKIAETEVSLDVETRRANQAEVDLLAVVKDRDGHS